MWKSLLPALILLAACSTPYEACVNSASRDLRVVTALIAEKETILARGYAITEETYTRTRFKHCEDDDGEIVLCRIEEEFKRDRPVAVNLAEERNILGELRAKRDDLEMQTRRTIASCRATYPAS